MRQGVPEDVQPGSVLRNRPFLLLWSAQVLSQTAASALLYALMVFVEERTNSSVQMSILVLSTILPSVVFGMAAGVFVDRWNKKKVLVATNLLRGLAVLLFAWLHQSLAVIYAINLIFSTITQFFAPAEVASIPALVRRRQLIEANGLFNLTFSMSQLVGFVFVGPALVKSVGVVGLFVSMAVVYFVCAALVGLIQVKEPARLPGGKSTDLLRGVLSDLREGWHVLSRDRAISLALVNVTLANSLLLIVGMLAPGYVSRVLGMMPEDAVIIMAPGGVGVLLGIVVLRYLTLRYAKEYLATVGLFLTAGVLYALGLVGNLGTGLAARTYALLAAVDQANFPLLVGAVMVLALLLGLAYAVVNVPAQTVLQERCPVEVRGRVFATQFVVANAVSLAPLIFLGGLADLVGVNVVVFLAATAVLGMGFFSRHRTQVRVSSLPLEGDQ
ncbi:MAG: MFS transporter [Chloroflexi bacterium]|nr:MFS transporter [Chloroflexota bacterium]